jgi:hypothetical protein
VKKQKEPHATIDTPEALSAAVPGDTNEGGTQNLPKLSTEPATASVLYVPSEQSQPHAPTRIKARMPQDDRLKYMAPVYARRLHDVSGIMNRYLDRNEGTAHEIEKRINALETLCGFVETGLHEVAAEYAIKNGIRNSLLQGGFGYPSLTGAHFDYIVTVMPHRTAEMRELIYQRRLTAWKTTDRAPKLSDANTESLSTDETTTTSQDDELEEPEASSTEPDAA